MELTRILIADSDESFCWALQMRLQERFHVCMCMDGMETVELVHRFSPDVAIIDLELPVLNGMALIHQLERENGETKYIWTSSSVDPHYAQRIGQKRMENYMEKPCPVYRIIERIEALLSGFIKQRPDEACRKHIAEILISLNVPVKLKGYRYIKEAARLMAEDPEQSITKELYPAVAALCGGSAQQVERAIRGAIYAAWAKRNSDAWNKIFGARYSDRDKKPTNAEFICRLTEQIYVKEIAA